MSWGDVWVCTEATRPAIGAEGPQAPWVKAGVVTRDERALIEATQKLRTTRDRHPRAVEFHLHLYTRDVALDRSGASARALTFAPDGLWLAIDVTPEGTPDAPRYVCFAQRVHPTSDKRQAAKPPAGSPRPVATVHLRGRAKSGVSPLEWAYRAPSAR